MPAGFYWGANSPYLRGVWIKVFRAPKVLDPTTAIIMGEDGITKNVNGAHIIYECMTNRDWGMGANPSIFDIDSFNVSAQTLFDEVFGLSLMWTRQTEIEAFIGEVVDHVHGTLFSNPRTGLMTFKLLREDFDYDSLRVISPDNAKLSNFQRKMWGETSNEIVVTYTDPANEGEKTIGAQDIANIQMTGGIISAGRNYYAIRDGTLAARVAERDLRAAAQPLATCDVELDRASWDLLPGEVVRLTWPEKGIENLVVRTGIVNYGKIGAGVIKTNLFEDIFSFASSSYLEPPATEWESPSADPAPLVNRIIMTAPAYFTATGLGLSTPEDLDPPEVVAMVIAARNTNDDIDYELIAQTVNTAGATAYASFGSKDFVSGATLLADIPQNALTSIYSFADVRGAVPAVGWFVVFGTADEETTEIGYILQTSPTGGWNIARGVLDTVPRAWPAGTRVYFIPPGVDYIDPTRRVEGSDAVYRLLSHTSRGILAFADAPEDVVEMTDRPHRPLRPALIRANATAFGSIGAGGHDIEMTWVNRNRLLEAGQAVSWYADTVTPETGQTTTIYALKSDGTVITTHDGLTGVAFTLPLASFGAETAGRIRVTSKRDGLESMQGLEIEVASLASYTLGFSGDVTDGLKLSGDAQSGADKLLLGRE